MPHKVKKLRQFSVHARHLDTSVSMFPREPCRTFGEIKHELQSLYEPGDKGSKDDADDTPLAF
jgi:hypothetical protein